MCQRRRSSSSSRPGCVNSKRENCLCGTGKGYAGASGSRDLLNHVDAAWQNSHDHHSSSYKTYDEDEAKQKLCTRIKQHLSFQTKKMRFVIPRVPLLPIYVRRCRYTIALALPSSTSFYFSFSFFILVLACAFSGHFFLSFFRTFFYWNARLRSQRVYSLVLHLLCFAAQQTPEGGALFHTSPAPRSQRGCIAPNRVHQKGL